MPSALRGAGHGRATQPGSDDRSVSPWACHQECAHRLTAHAQQWSDCDRYPGGVAAYTDARPVPWYVGTSDDENYPLGPARSHIGKHNLLALPVQVWPGEEWNSCLVAISMRHPSHQRQLPCSGRKCTVQHHARKGTRPHQNRTPNVFRSPVQVPFQMSDGGHLHIFRGPSALG